VRPQATRQEVERQRRLRPAEAPTSVLAQIWDDPHRGSPPQRPGRQGDTADQLLVREVNEQTVLRLGDRREPGAPEPETVELICECQGRGCRGPLEVSLADYEAVRLFPTRFLIRRGHRVGVDEQVVAREPGFVVVEKTGHSARAAIRLDPRRRHGGFLPAA
jgi:hypothetical protein